MTRLLAGGPLAYPLRSGSQTGGEVYERELLCRLPQHGVDLALGLPRGHPHSSPPPGWRVTALPDRSGLPWSAQALAFLPFALRLVRRERVDLLRGHSIRLTGPPLLAAKRLTGGSVPVVLHQHHLEPRWAKVEAAIMARADAVITVSEHSRDQLAALGVPRERVHVVPDGVDASAPLDPWPDAWPPGDGPRLLYLGRLEERKRAHVAIEAAALMPDARLVVAGDGPSRGELEALARDGRATAASFLGRVTETDKWRLLDAADVLLFPSTLEGFGLVVAEAQARGLPVVAAAGTGTADTLVHGESGLLTASTPAAFAEAALAVAQRPQMRERAREHGRRFSWDASAAAVAAIYRGLVT